MNAITEYTFHTHTIRIFPSEDSLSFYAVASDIAAALGYAEAKDFTRQVPDKHKGRRMVPTPSGIQEMLVIDEPGLYRGVLRSNKPEAEPFADWVTEDVLPSIRRTGGYQHRPKPLTSAELKDLLGMDMVLPVAEYLHLVARNEAPAPAPAAPAKPAPRLHWSAEEDAQLRTLVADGLKPAAIARYMNRTRDAVIHRLDRIGKAATPT